MEFRLRLRFGNVAAVSADVERAFRVFLLAVLHRAGKRRQNVHIRILMLSNISLDLVEIPHRRQTGIRDNHHFPLTADLVAGRLAECLDDDRRLLADVVRVELLVFLDELGGTALRQFRILRRILGNAVARLIRHVIPQHIEDKALLDRLPHTVDMERVETAIRPRFSEHLQSL